MVEPAGVRPGQGTPVPKEGPQPVDPYGNPGSDLFDWYAVNDALRAAGMGDGSWNIAGNNHSPVQAMEQVKNPAFDPLKNPDVNPFVNQPKNDYTIGVVNKNTGQLYKIHLTRSTPDASGKYSYAVSGRDDQGKLDTTSPAGYKDIQQLGPFADGHKELWGTNTQTGAFEKMPGAPPNLGKLDGWNDVKQVDDGQGHKIWVGTSPDGKPMQPIPGAPQINVDKYVPGSVKQVTKNGKQVYVGMNAQTQQWEDIPELGSEAVKPTVVTANKNVYTVDPNGNLVLAAGVAQPKEDDEQWVDAASGYAKRQVFKNGDWHDDTDTPWKAVNPATQRAAGAIPPKGSTVWTPAGDKLIALTADGNGGTVYQLGPNGEPPEVRPIPGITQPTSAGTAGASDEYLPQRRDPITGKLLPPEKNINWQPTSPADRVRQLTQQAQQKQQDLHAQVVNGSLSEDEANKQFDQFWNQTIEPAKQEIQLAQQYKTQDENRQNLQVAQGTVSSILQAETNPNEIQVGPGFGNLMGKIASATGQGKFVGPISGDEINNALVYQRPDYAQQAEQITAQALAHISPTAAQKVGGGTPGALQQPQDITSGLNRTNFQWGGGYPTGGPGAPGGGPVQTNVQTNPALAAANQANNQGFNPQGSTAALNARGLMDNPQGRAIAAGQTPVAAGGAPTVPGLYNPAYQQGMMSGVGQPATGPVAGQMIPGLGVPYNPSGPPADYAVYSPSGYSMPSGRAGNPQDLDPGFTSGAPNLGAPPAGGVPPTPAVPQQNFVNPQALKTFDDQQQGQLQAVQQMLQDRARALAQSQSMIPTSWNAWGQYKPSF